MASKWLVKIWFRFGNLGHILKCSCYEFMSRKEEFRAFVESKQGDLDRLGVEYIGLFGSTVHGEDHFRCEIDLMTPESLSRHFGPRILSETEYVEIAS